MMDELNWQPQIDPSVCTGCGDCVIVCAVNALALLGETAVLVQPAACTYCGECEAACDVDAVALPYQIVPATSKG